MVLEFCPFGALSYQLYKNHNLQLTPKLQLKITLDITLGLRCLHTVVPPIIHRDLRSPNVFLYSIDENDPVVAKVSASTS